jgi:hypothetical protein
MEPPGHHAGVVFAIRAEQEVVGNEPAAFTEIHAPELGASGATSATSTATPSPVCVAAACGSALASQEA